MIAPMHRPRRVTLAAGAVLAVALFVRGKWSFALDLEAGTRGVPPVLMLELVQPGLLEAARLVAAETGAVYLMPREHDPLAYQRLLEMVYPRRLRSYDPATLRAGDLVVLAAAHGLEMPSDEVLCRGAVRVVRVR